MSDADGLGGYSARPVSSAHHRSRPLQRHHTIQNSDDAYVGWDHGGGLVVVLALHVL